MKKLTLPELASQVFQTIKTREGVTTRAELNHTFKATSNPANNEDLTKVLKSLLIHGYLYKKQDPDTLMVSFWSSDRAPVLGKGDPMAMSALVDKDQGLEVPDYLVKSVERVTPKAEPNHTETAKKEQPKKFTGNIKEQLQDIVDSFQGAAFCLRDVYSVIDLTQSKRCSENTIRSGLEVLVSNHRLNSWVESKRIYYQATAVETRTREKENEEKEPNVLKSAEGERVTRVLVSYDDGTCETFDLTRVPVSVQIELKPVSRSGP